MDGTGSPAALERGIAESVDATLRLEARRSETAIAGVRVIALVLVAVLDLFLWWQPPGFRLPYRFSLLNALLAAVWLVPACLLAAALRRGWYRDWLRLAMPVADGLALISLVSCIFLTAQERATVAPAAMNAGIAAALLAFSGSLRLHRMAAQLSTLMAMACFATAATLAGHPLPEVGFGVALLFAMGLMGRWTTDVVRRAVESEVGRLVLGRFLPPEVVEGAHRQPLALVTQPRRMDVTVLVSDLRGFTAMTERLSPEDLLATLNRVHGIVTEAVESNGGRVDKFMGDGVLAVFGMTAEGSCHAAQAIAAAHDMLRRTCGLRDPRGEPLSLGVGVHTGPVIAGCLGSGARLEYTVLGDTVNTASRLQDMTKEFHEHALFSGATQAAAGDMAAALRPLGTAPVRGRQAEVALFGLTQP